jgi:hypothetical protein
MHGAAFGDYPLWQAALPGTVRADGGAMSKILRGLAAGYGAKKLGGGGCGCGTIIVFIILWYILGHFGIFK